MNQMKIEQDIDYGLTPQQKKVFNRLQRAITACEEANIYLYDDYGTLSGINGKVCQKTLMTGEGYEQMLNRNDEPWVYLNEFVPSRIKSENLSPNADDSMIIVLSPGWENFIID